MNSPTLDPFHSHSSSGNSAGALVITALILGIATAAAVFFLKMPKQAADVPAANNPLAGIFSETRSDNSKDWDFYTAEIDNVIQELRAAKENYETKSKALIETQLRLESEKEELARIRKDIETMRSQLTGQIHSLASSKAATPSSTTPQKPQ